VECFPEKVPRATEGLEGTVVASWAAGDAAQGGGAEPLVWHAVSTSHHDRPPKKGLKDAGREAPNEQVRMIVEDGGTVAGAHIGEGRTVLAVGGPPEHDPGAGR
jgi:hypothetical protein